MAFDSKKTYHEFVNVQLQALLGEQFGCRETVARAFAHGVGVGAAGDGPPTEESIELMLKLVNDVIGKTPSIH